MNARRFWIALLVGIAMVGPDLGPARAAIKVRQPLLEEPPSPAKPGDHARPAARGSDEAFFVGTVIFARGGQMVAEIPEGARDRERMVLFDAGLRRRGKLVVVKALDSGVYLLAPMGSVSASAGDFLARETELEAAARVLRENRLESYQEFVELFPDSQYAPRMGREMFRVTMKESYPTFPGTVVEGRLQLAEQVSREVSLGQVLLVLDRFIIARSDERGKFRIEGLPKLDQSVELKMRVKDPKFRMAEEVSVSLPAESFGELQAELPVKFTPTVLAGRVLDERGAPLPGVEVWTSPYTMEVLSDGEGSYQISRRKKLDASGAPSAGDEPLFGGDYEVYAYRKGYGVERVTSAAESYQENPVAALRLTRQDPREEEVPPIGLDLRAYVGAQSTNLALPQGGGPKLNP